MTKIYEIKARKVFHTTRIPEADWGINYYRGCTHGCIYCYLKFLCKWRRQKEKWGEFVDVKINAPELVTEESKNKEGTVILCTSGDAYQPIDKKYQLTRKILKNLNSELRLLVLTKSDPILRDADLFRKFRKCELGLTITTLDRDVKRVFEPFSPNPHKRLKALKKLKKKGFHTYVFVGPIFPYLTDLDEIFREVSPFVDHLSFEDLNLKPCKKEVSEAIRTNFPELEEKYKNLSRKFWPEKENEIRKLGREYGKPVRIYFKNTESLKFR